MDPLSIISLAGTAISGIGSIFGASAEEQQRQAQHEAQLRNVRRQNQARMDRYQDQLMMRNARQKMAIADYNLRKVGYENTAININQGFNNAYVNEQLRMAEEFRSAVFGKQAMNNAAAQTLGKRAARNVTGNTAARGAALDAAAYGRNEEILRQSLRGKVFASGQRVKQMNEERNNALFREWSKVAATPVFTPAPRAPRQLDGPMAPQGGGMRMASAVLGAAGSFATAAAGMDWGGGSGSGSTNDSLKIGSTDWGSGSTFGNVGYTSDFKAPYNYSPFRY